MIPVAVIAQKISTPHALFHIEHKAVSPIARVDERHKKNLYLSLSLVNFLPPMQQARPCRAGGAPNWDSPFPHGEGGGGRGGLNGGCCMGYRGGGVERVLRLCCKWGEGGGGRDSC
jgi:hypothetical protein